MKKLLTLLLATIPFVSCAEETDKPAPAAIPDLKVIIETDKGTIEGVLYASKTPVTVASFANLASRKFYDKLTFHRVIPNFMIQGGCPEGTGAGSPGYLFDDEIVKDLKHDRAGIFSMANAGPGTNGSQFFITHEPTPWLDGKHTVFGHVTKGQDIVNTIAMGDTIKSIRIEGDTEALFKQQKEQVDAWNKVLDEAKP
jgi:peptidyl-prolyl cis-trans isomerase B (cyclophilin B)